MKFRRPLLLAAAVAALVAAFAGVTAVWYDQRPASAELKPDPPSPGDDDLLGPPYTNAMRAHDEGLAKGLVWWGVAVVAAAAAGTAGVVGLRRALALDATSLYWAAAALAAGSAFFLWAATPDRNRIVMGPPDRVLRQIWRERGDQRQRTALAVALLASAVGVTAVARRSAAREQRGTTSDSPILACAARPN